MCGIAGYFGSTPRLPNQIQAALNSMQNRGPDHSDHQSFQKNNYTTHLCHSRLSILDLDARSHQPYGDSEHQLVYNGEIYNYIEIKKELEERGCHFNTSGDTEVLFKALKTWGKDALQKLNGMWSFAYYHIKENKLWLCRDRFGEKPLYLRKDSSGLTFASEVKTIEALRSERESLNHEHIMRYITLGYKSLYKKEDNFFSKIKMLPRAHILEIDESGHETLSSYWEPKLSTKSMSYEEATEGFKERLIRSVKTRMRTDVPLAFCLSGGVDSASLASIASRELGLDIQTYSIIDGDPRYNESDNINATIDDLKCKNTMVHLEPGQEHLNNLKQLIQYHDAPVATITYYIHSLLMKEVAASGIKVSISGTAADELVTGYYDHFLCFLHEMRDQPSYPEHLNAWKTHILPIIRNPLLQDPQLYQKDINFRDHIYFKQDVFATYLKQDFQEAFSETHYHDSLLRNRMLNELFHEATAMILREDDMNCMYYSIENRSPFLDHELMEFAYSIPQDYLMRDGRAKVILRDSVKGILNEQVRQDRRKRGFNAALHSLVDFQAPETRELILDNSPIYDIIQRDKIEKAMNEKELPNSFSKFLFYFISSKFFMDQRA